MTLQSPKKVKENPFDFKRAIIKSPQIPPPSDPYNIGLNFWSVIAYFLDKIANISKVAYYTTTLKFCEHFHFTLWCKFFFEFMNEKQRGYPYVFFRFRLKYYRWTSPTLHDTKFTYIIVIFNSIATSIDGCYPTSRIAWRGGLTWLVSERG